jgi:hypothetical protein
MIVNVKQHKTGGKKIYWYGKSKKQMGTGFLEKAEFKHLKSIHLILLKYALQGSSLGFFYLIKGSVLFFNLHIILCYKAT